MKKEVYIVIQWPEIREYVDLKGFRDNSYPINDGKGINDFGISAYFVNKEWLESIS